MSKADRLHYLVSYSNRIFLNEIDRKEGFDTYETILDVRSRIVPLAIKNRNHLLSIYLIIFVLLSPLWNILYLIKSLIDKTKANRIEYKGERLFLLASVALPRVVDNAGIKVRDNEKWLPLPWTKTKSLIIQDIITVFNLVKLSDILSAYWDSILVAFYLLRKKGRIYVLPSSKAYIWFLYNRAIRRIPYNVELLFANQKDIYAPLLDNLPHNKKSLIQHGTEIVMVNPNNIGEPYYRFIEEGGYWVNNMPFKYKHLSQVYVFTKKELKALSKSILNTLPKITFVGYSLKGFNENLKGDKAILIVGYYDLFYERETKLIELLQNKGIKIYLKNHPVFPDSVYDGLLSLYDFKLLSGQRFPKVDYVFTYCSTLALEYEELGAKIIFYDKMDDATLQDAVYNVLTALAD